MVQTVEPSTLRETENSVFSISYIDNDKPALISAEPSDQQLPTPATAVPQV